MCSVIPFLSRDAFVSTNRRAIAIMFVSLSVWDGRALWSYGAFSADLSLRLDSPMFLAPWHLSMSIYSQPSRKSGVAYRLYYADVIMCYKIVFGDYWLFWRKVICQLHHTRIHTDALWRHIRRTHSNNNDWAFQGRLALSRPTVVLDCGRA